MWYTQDFVTRVVGAETSTTEVAVTLLPAFILPPCHQDGQIVPQEQPPRSFFKSPSQVRLSPTPHSSTPSFLSVLSDTASPPSFFLPLSLAAPGVGGAPDLLVLSSSQAQLGAAAGWQVGSCSLSLSIPLTLTFKNQCHN